MVHVVYFAVGGSPQTNTAGYDDAFRLSPSITGLSRMKASFNPGFDDNKLDSGLKF